MKKTALIILAAAIAGSGYAGTSWYFGKQTEAIVNAQYDQLLLAAPYLEIAERDYQRGIFTSRDSVKLAINKQLTGASTSTNGESGEDDTLHLILDSQIQHGPFPGFSNYAAAVSVTEVTLPEAIDSDLKQLLGGQSPFTQHTTFKMDGSGHAIFSSPAFELELPDPEGDSEEGLKLTWRGIEGNMAFSANMQQFQFDAEAPELLFISESDEVKIKLSGISMQSEQQKIFEDIPVFFSGNQQVSVNEVALDIPDAETGKLLIKELRYEVNLPHQGEFVDMVERMSIDSLRLGEDSIGPIHFDISLKHLHARALAEISQAFMSIYSDAMMASSDSTVMMENLMPVFTEQGTKLLQHQPEFHLDRVSLANAQGESSFAGRVRLNQFDLEQAMANPMFLLTQLDASGELDLQEEMVIELLRNPPGKAVMAQSVADPETLETESAMRAEQFQQQVAMLTDQGYLTREGKRLKSKAEFKQGQLLINGKPFMPPQLDSGQQ